MTRRAGRPIVNSTGALIRARGSSAMHARPQAAPVVQGVRGERGRNVHVGSRTSLMVPLGARRVWSRDHEAMLRELADLHGCWAHQMIAGRKRRQILGGPEDRD